MNEPGPQSRDLADRVGLWDVTETVWPTPGAAPVVTTGLVAERRMVGPFLQEEIRPADAKPGIDVKRMDYLTFNRVEGRYDYVSMDTRAPVGLMPAWSFGPAVDGVIRVEFAPFAVPGDGAAVSGQMLRMDTVVAHQGSDRDTKDQHFNLADGTGTTWLAHRYAYARHH